MDYGLMCGDKCDWSFQQIINKYLNYFYDFFYL